MGFQHVSNTNKAQDAATNDTIDYISFSTSACASLSIHINVSLSRVALVCHDSVN